jgi:hypothetical protein
MSKLTRSRLALFAAASSTLCLAPDCQSTRTQTFSLSAPGTDAATMEQVRTHAVAGAEQVERFFGREFPRSFEVIVVPDRAAFDAALPAEWGLTPTQCWMVACGVAEHLWILSPSVWREQACEHDPNDSEHVRGIVEHELVHVFHGQANPSGDFSAVEGLDWFVEGLAVYASGQLDQRHMLSAADALKAGAAPEHLADAWKGKYRYGVSGSIVRCLDRRVGRAVISKMLAATTQAEALSLAGMSEDELLSAWRASVLAESADHH